MSLKATLEKFEKEWEKDFSEPSKYNPDQWVMLSPTKYKQFLITTLKEAIEEVKPKEKDRLTYYKENGEWFDENKVDGWNAYSKELQQNITHYFEN